MFFDCPCKIIATIKKELLLLGELYLVLGIWTLQEVLFVRFSEAAWLLLVLRVFRWSLSCLAPLGPEFLPLGPRGQKLAGAAKRAGRGEKKILKYCLTFNKVSTWFTKLNLSFKRYGIEWILFKTFQDLQILWHRKKLCLVCLKNHSDIPRGSLLVDWWARFLHSKTPLIRKILLASNHSCLCVPLEVRGPMMLLPPLPIILIFSGRLSRFQTWFPSRQSPIPTAEHCGRPLLHLVCSLRPLEWRWWGAEEGMGRGYQVIIVTGHIFWDCTATGEEWKNIVLCVCGSFGHRSWRELCVWLDASLAVLELNQCFNFILNQLEKRHITVKTNVVTCNACDMTWLNAGLPVFGTGIVLAERVSALGIASQPAETGATIGPICKIKQTILSCTINTHIKTLTCRKTAEGKFHN